MEEIKNQVVQSAQKIFATLGSGYSEYIYHRAMEVEGQKNQWQFESKKIIPISYCGFNIGYGEADLVINNSVVCEFKALNSDIRLQEVTQIKNYLNSLPHYRLGILINFPQPSGSRPARDHIDVKFVYPNESQDLGGEIGGEDNNDEEDVLIDNIDDEIIVKSTPDVSEMEKALNCHS